MSLLGASMTVITIDLPQRSQIVDCSSALDAGIRLLPFSLGIPIGSFSVNIVAATTKTYPIVVVLIGSIVQLVSLSLLAASPGFGSQSPAQYVLEATAALGMGATFSTLVISTPHAVEKRDLGKYPKRSFEGAC